MDRMFNRALVSLFATLGLVGVLAASAADSVPVSFDIQLTSFGAPESSFTAGVTNHIQNQPIAGILTGGDLGPGTISAVRNDIVNTNTGHEVVNGMFTVAAMLGSWSGMLTASRLSATSPFTGHFQAVGDDGSMLINGEVQFFGGGTGHFEAILVTP